MTNELLTAHEIMTQLQAIGELHWITPSESWQSSERRYSRRYDYREQRYIEPRPELAPEWSEHYGDWTELKSTDEITPAAFVLIGRTGYSDYSGSIVEASNHKVILEALEALELEENADYIDYSGGYGTRELAVRVGALQERLPDNNGWVANLIDILSGLDDYPVADEDAMSHMEIESQNEAWESMYRSDFMRELEKYLASYIRARVEDEIPGKFGSLDATDELAEYCEDGDWNTPALADKWFYELAEYANEYWVNEQGTDSYIDVERVISNGLGRELKHWPEGDKKRRELAREIAETVNAAYLASKATV